MQYLFKKQLQNKVIEKENIGGEMMGSQRLSLQKYQIPICPSCGNRMQGFSASFHHYQCPNCNTELQSIKVQATQGFEWVIAGVCLLLIIGAIAELCS